jgi:hypothetical protein
MNTWTIVLILLIGAVLLWFNRPTKEGFGVINDGQKPFMGSQETLFHEQLPKEISINGTLQLAASTVNGALKQPDLFLPISPDRDFSIYFRRNEHMILDKDSMCRGAAHPRNLQRAANATMGCGWWFVEDATGTSVGAYGSADRPINRTIATQYPGGRWIWNLQDAARHEDIKRCKRIRTCGAIGADTVRGECGFCPDTGRGVPVNGQRTKYTDEDASCPSAPITDSTQCPVGQVIRSTDAEVILDDNGIAQGNAGSSETYASECEPGPGGVLSVPCLVLLAESMGMSSQGAIIRILQSNRTIDPTTRYALTILQTDAGYTIPDSVFGSGRITQDSASSAYGRIVELQNTGTLPRIKESAKYLAIGNPNYNPCEYNDTDGGPFPVMCMEREFRKAGCQPSGSAAPTESNKNDLSSRFPTYGQLKTHFANMYASMKSTNLQVQDDAVQKCLGTRLYSPRIDKCDETGIEYLVYTRNGGQDGSFVGRYISKQGLVNPDTNHVNQLMQKVNSTMFRARTFIKPTTSTIVSIRGTCPTDACSVLVNKASSGVTRNALSTTQGITDYNWLVELNPSTNASQMEIVFGKDVATGTLKYPASSQYITDNLGKFQLRQDSWKPVIALDFFRESAADVNDVVRTSASNISYGTIGTRKCANFNGSTKVEIPQGIHSDTIRSICVMVNASAASSGDMEFKSLFQGENRTVSPSSLLFMGNPLGRFSFFHASYRSNGSLYNYMRRSEGSQRDFPVSSSINNWMHYCIVFTNDHRKQFTAYINGVKQSPVTSDQNIGLLSVILEKVVIGETFRGGMSWFHIYDYPLSDQEVLRDMNYDNPNYVMPVPAVPELIAPLMSGFNSYPNNDYSGNDYTYLTLSGNSYEQNRNDCISECLNNPRCITYTISRAAPNTCWMKENIGPRLPIPQPHPGADTGMIQNREVNIQSQNTAYFGREVNISVSGNTAGQQVQLSNTPQEFIYDSSSETFRTKQGMCLDVYGGFTNNGAKVIQWPCHGGPNQAWQFDTEGRIHPKHAPDKCLDAVAGGGWNRRDVGIWDCHSGMHQKWIVPTPSSSANRRGVGAEETFVTAYQHCNYGGYSVKMYPGLWSASDTFPNDDLSSIRVPQGMRATLYRHGPDGPSVTVTSDVSCFVNIRFTDGVSVNDQVSNILVEKI